MVTNGDDTSCGELWIMYKIVESLCYTTEINTLYVSYTSVTIFKNGCLKNWETEIKCKGPC